MCELASPSITPQQVGLLGHREKHASSSSPQVLQQPVGVGFPSLLFLKPSLYPGEKPQGLQDLLWVKEESVFLANGP